MISHYKNEIINVKILLVPFFCISFVSLAQRNKWNMRINASDVWEVIVQSQLLCAVVLARTENGQ
jgi:multisubunit Na+/H+ antiporter MnhF subunit